MSASSFAHSLAIQSTLPRLTVGMSRPVNVGFLAPLSGPVESWGLPGLHGCRIWCDWLNAAGGLLIGGRRYPVRLVEYDCDYDPARALEGARVLVEEHDVKLVMMLGGDTLNLAQDYLTRNRVLTSTLLPSDLSPDTPYLIAPSESLPVYTVTSVDWLRRAHPQVKTVALCSQKDALGLPALATYRAAFKAAGIAMVKEVQYEDDAVDPAPIVDPMLASGAEVLCWCSSYTPMVHELTAYAYARGFQGQIMSCTFDHYDRLVARTSADFMEGALFQFPDFDDPLLSEKTFFFNQPHVFFEQYNARFPGSWSAVSWEYAAILDIWHGAVQQAGAFETPTVLAAMKQLGEVSHAFGPAEWWGEEIFGISNALVGDWPVVTIQQGRARIVEFGSIPAWLQRHERLLKQEFSSLGQLWQQRLGRDLPSDLAPREARI